MPDRNEGPAEEVPEASWNHEERDEHEAARLQHLLGSSLGTKDQPTDFANGEVVVGKIIFMKYKKVRGRTKAQWLKARAADGRTFVIPKFLFQLEENPIDYYEKGDEITVKKIYWDKKHSHTCWKILNVRSCSIKSPLADA